MINQQYRDLLDWFMVSDPWPLTTEQHDRVEAMLDKEALTRGYENWIVAYHEVTREDELCARSTER